MLATQFSLKGRVVLVTGGSKGLGKAMARGFAEAGADIFISSRHADELKAAAAEIGRGTEARVAWAVADMTKRGDVQVLADTALKELGRVDVLVNNAGGNVPQSIEKITDEEWDKIVELNLTSCMRMTRALVPQMIERRWGRVIHVSSIMGQASRAARNSYSATKSALIGLARASALDLGKYGITVNCLAPGPFLTDLPATVLTKEEQQEFADAAALGRWGDPKELAGPALLLASDAGSYITGSVLTVDGGVLASAF